MMIVGAGDAVARLPADGSAMRVGPGLLVSSSSSSSPSSADDDYGGFLVTARPGVLRQTKGGKLWVETRSRRYTPAAGDTVVGVIVDRRGDGYSVDIRGGTTGGGGGGGSGEASASLPALAFEGATRRSRPTLRAGDAVFCRVAAAQRHVEAELTCVDEAGRAGGLGPLGPGAVVEVTTAHARALLAATGAAAAAAGAASSKKASSSASSSSSAPASNTSVSPIVAALAATGLPFEVAVGANGRVWVGGPDAAAVSAAARAIEGSDGVLDAREAEAIARRAVEAVRAAGGTR